MENEFNEVVEPASNDGQTEFSNFMGANAENEYESSNAIRSEFNNDVPASSTPKKKNALSFSAVMAMISGVLVTVVTIAVIAGNASNYSAVFNALNVYGNSFAYDVSVSFDYTVEEGTTVDFSTVDTSLRLIVANSTTSRVVDLQVQGNNTADNPVQIETIEDGKYHVTYTFVGSVDSLEQGTMYKVEIISVSGDKPVTIASKEIKTLDGAISKINDVTYKCNCLTDDTFEFTIDYIDENSFYSDFSYAILNMDKTDTSIADVAIENASKKQTIEHITALAGGTYLLQIKYLSSAYSDTQDESGGKQTEQTIEIEIKI